MPNTLIILDSNEYIFRLTEQNSQSAKLIDQLGKHKIIVPRTVVQEVERNIPDEMVYTQSRDKLAI